MKEADDRRDSSEFVGAMQASLAVQCSKFQRSRGGYDFAVGPLTS